MRLTIDTTDIPVLGYTFEPAQTELKAKLGKPGEALWDSFRKGLQFSIFVEQKCDSAGGEMAEVVENMSHLAPEDRAAIATYIKALPAP